MRQLTLILLYSYTLILDEVSVGDSQRAAMSKCFPPRPSIPLFLNHKAYSDTRYLKYKWVFYLQKRTAKPGMFHACNLYSDVCNDPELF